MSELLGQEQLDRVIDACLAVDGAGAVRASVSHSWGGLTRFADSVIHQHVATETDSVSVTVVTPDGRRGFASGGVLSPEAAARTARAALEAARLSPPDPEFPGFAGPQDYPAYEGRYDEATATAGPKGRAEAVAAGLAAVGRGQRAAGSLAASASETVIATSEGARAYATVTSASFSAAVTGSEGGTGYDTESNVALSALDPARRAASASATCAAAERPGPVKPGVYEVVLQPDAVANLAYFLAFLAFDAKAYEDGQSPLCGRLGERVVSPLLTIRDDASRPGMPSLPFDGEATAKRPVDLIVDGVARNLVYDRETARRAGVSSTGHGAGIPESGPSLGVGALAANVAIEPGTSSVEELIAGVERGLLVTRFWYTRVVDPVRTLITGMTRDGTFLIEDGQVARSVRNLRWNESAMDLLANCTGVGNEARSLWGSLQVPALRSSTFTCTAVTDH
jgi:predicted Zn-dependent protease